MADTKKLTAIEEFQAALTDPPKARFATAALAVADEAPVTDYIYEFARQRLGGANPNVIAKSTGSSVTRPSTFTLVAVRNVCKDLPGNTRWKLSDKGEHDVR